MTITQLTIRQFLKSRSLAVIAIICLIPLAIAIIPHLLPEAESIRSLRSLMANTIFLTMYVTLLMPISVLVLASAAFGDEIDDKTLYILALKPVSRFRIMLEKLLSVFLVAIPVVWGTILIVWAVLSWGNMAALRDMIWPMLAGSLVGICGFGSIFLAISLFMRRTLLVGMFYVTIWEGALAGFLPGIRNFSISHYSRSMFSNLLADSRISVDNASETSRIMITILMIVAISLAVGTWRLRRMAID